MMIRDCGLRPQNTLYRCMDWPVTRSTLLFAWLGSSGTSSRNTSIPGWTIIPDISMYVWMLLTYLFPVHSSTLFLGHVCFQCNGFFLIIIFFLLFLLIYTIIIIIINIFFIFFLFFIIIIIIIITIQTNEVRGDQMPRSADLNWSA